MLHTHAVYLVFVHPHTQGHRGKALALSWELLEDIFTLRLRTRPCSYDLHSRAGHLRVRGPAAERLHRSSRQLPPHSSSCFLLVPRGAWERAKSQSCGGLSPRALLRPLHPAGGLPLLSTQPPAPAAALAASPLHTSGEAEGPTPGSCGEVPREEKISSTKHHLGRRGDQLLLQGRQTLKLHVFK